MYQRLALESVNNGKLLAHVNDAIDRAVSNICDPSTSAEQERTVTITLKLKPSPNRNKVTLVPKVETKLAQPLVDGTEISINVLKQTAAVFVGEQLGFDYDNELTT